MALPIGGCGATDLFLQRRLRLQSLGSAASSVRVFSPSTRLPAHPSCPPFRTTPPACPTTFLPTLPALLPTPPAHPSCPPPLAPSTSVVLPLAPTLPSAFSPASGAMRGPFRGGPLVVFEHGLLEGVAFVVFEHASCNGAVEGQGLETETQIQGERFTKS